MKKECLFITRLSEPGWNRARFYQIHL